MLVKKKGHYVTPKGFKIKHRLASKYYSKNRFKADPETVNQIIDDIPEIREYIDVPFYRAWKKALDNINSIKNAEEFSFDYEFKYPPYEHQKKMIAFIRALPCAALFAEPGTGKTYGAATMIDMRLKKGVIKNALIIAPRSIIRTGWYHDITKFTDIKPMIVHPSVNYGSVPDENFKKEKTVAGRLHMEGYNVYISTPDYVGNHIDDFINKKFDQVVVDESTMIGNLSDRTKEVLKLRDSIKYRLVMTGTPGDIEKIYNQMSFVDMCLEPTITKFREKYMIPDPYRKFVYNPAFGAADIIADKIRDRSLYLSKAECLDLPPRITKTIEVEPSDKIRKAYRKLYNESFVMINDKELTPKTKMTEVLKLHQILQGHVLIDEELEVIDKNPPKLKAIKKMVEDHDGKVIVWAHYRQDFANLKRIFKKYDPAVINGATRSVEDEEEKFRGDSKVMIAQPMSAKFGHTWCQAKLMIYYSYSYGLIAYLQSRDRNHRIGQDESVTEIRLTSGGIEDKILESIDSKKETAQDILDSIDEIQI